MGSRSNSPKNEKAHEVTIHDSPVADALYKFMKQGWLHHPIGSNFDFISIVSNLLSINLFFLLFCEGHKSQWIRNLISFIQKLRWSILPKMLFFI